ncbi:MAG TPA: DUF1674 domain-containing protein [Rhizomicrobium sp.]|jgi:hypothetical protein
MPKGDTKGRKRPADVIGAVGKIATAEDETKPWSEIAERIRLAGERARAEAEARRAASKPEHLPKEVNGPKGPEPTRYGDWEKKGIASDF